MDETETLRSQVEELRAEVERLRTQQAGHVCYSPESPYARWFQNTACAAPCPPPVITIPPGEKFTFTRDIGVAGCAGGVM